MADYTPDGHPKKEGYNNPNNPYDTGYQGQKNTEWLLYYTGRGPKPGTPEYKAYWAARSKGKKDPNSIWSVANYQGLNSIPGAGTYMDSQAQAQLAFDQAVAQLWAQRENQQHQAGLTAGWKVDPLAQYGQYQGMLHDQGAGLDAADQEAQTRGLFGGGLANQGEAPIRYAAGQQNSAFQNLIGQEESSYQQSLGQLQQQRQMAMLAALQAAQNNAPYPSGDPGYQQPQGDPYASTGSVVRAPAYHGPQNVGIVQPSYTPQRRAPMISRTPFRPTGTQVRHM